MLCPRCAPTFAKILQDDHISRGGATGGGLGEGGGARAPPPVGGVSPPPVGEFKDFSRGWVGYDFH